MQRLALIQHLLIGAWYLHHYDAMSTEINK